MDSDVEERLGNCLSMAEALADAMTAAVSGRADTWRHASFRQFVRKYNELAELANSVERVNAPLDFWDLDRVPGIGDTIPMQQEAYFESVRANLAILIAYLRNRVRPKDRRISEIADFSRQNCDGRHFDSRSARRTFRTPLSSC